MGKGFYTYIFSLAIIAGIYILLSGFYNEKPIKKNGWLIIHFLNIANKEKLSKDSIYKNAFGEEYSVSKLKYYISNVQVNNFKEPESYHLIDAFASDSISIALPPGKYNNIKFLLGVDSIKNCSGAQSGALDPLNEMFWTWNSGYVMFKLEGISTASTADLHRIEQHIGGYKGRDKVMREINLPLYINPIIITENKYQSLTIQMDLDKLWQGINDIKINILPVITTVGEQAKKAADNFPKMFSVSLTQ